MIGQVTALRGIVSLVAIYHMGNLPGNQMNMQLVKNKFLFPFCCELFSFTEQSIVSPLTKGWLSLSLSKHCKKG